jgi:hypothetical protein
MGNSVAYRPPRRARPACLRARARSQATGLSPGPGIDHCRTPAVAPHPVGRTYYSKSCTKIMLYL